MKGRILVIDDDAIFAKSLQKIFEREGFEVSSCTDSRAALENIKAGDFDLILCDYLMPHLTGLELLKQWQKGGSHELFILMTGYGSIEGAVEAINLGAFDYIVKSVDIEELIFKIKNAFNVIGLEKDISLYQQKEERRFGFQNIIGKSRQMTQVFERIENVAATENTTVLILGESGTGKELVAKAIHKLSRRKKRHLLEIDCTTLPPNLLESELFGYEKGAFTDAGRTKIGLVEIADGGTLFLDEIGDLDLTIQSKLLRLLQERTFRRLGGTKDHKVDIRIITATNRDLKKMVEEQRFREDLYYRLGVFSIQLAPLRERGNDIILLAEGFIEQFNIEFKKNVRGYDKDFEGFLKTYDFPGNVRELKNIIEQAMILNKTDILTTEYIPDSLYGGSQNDKGKSSDVCKLTIPLGEGTDCFEFVERRLIEHALDYVNGNQSKAATLLGISRHALKRRLDKFQEKTSR